GQALDETVAHRPERVAAVTGAAPGEPLTVDHLARLLSSAQGSLQGVGDATVVPIVNMVDDGSAQTAARRIAERALAATRRFDRVVLAAMTARDPLIEVIDR
ncbi:MAG: selenium cofactor biosynthesis protein YqeC, partial [Geminicoccaceae bacterium]